MIIIDGFLVSKGRKTEKKFHLCKYFKSNFQTTCIGDNKIVDFLVIQDPGLCCLTVDYRFLEAYGEKAVQKHFKACADVLRGALLVRQGNDKKTFALLAFFRQIDGQLTYPDSAPYRLTRTDVEPVKLDWNCTQGYYKHLSPVVPALLDKALLDSIISILNDDSFKEEAFPAEYLESVKVK